MPSLPTIDDAPVDAPIYSFPGDPIHNGTAWASQASPDPWEPMILALDGGGIRGYSSLLMLDALMQHVIEYERKLFGRELNPDNILPCHYFDFMYGTSTGGLIATMLGRLRMSIPQCLQIYRRVGESLFGTQRSKVPFTTKYHHRPLQDAVKQITKAHCKQHPTPGECDGSDWYPWDLAINNKDGVDFNRHVCQAICLAAVHNGRLDEAHLLRTHDIHYQDIPNWIAPYNEGADPLRIWEVNRATSAAPFYFEPFEAEVKGKRWNFKDGGLRANSPSTTAYAEFVATHGEDADPALLLSVGTGRSDHSQDGFASSWPGPFGSSVMMRKIAEKFAVLRNVLVKYTDAEEKHSHMKIIARGEHTWYKRLNVTEGMQHMRLDDWRRGTYGGTRDFPGGATLSHIEAAVGAELARDLDRRYDAYAPPRVVIQHVAERLVRQRMARQELAEQGIERLRWEVYMGFYMSGERAEGPDVPIRHATDGDQSGLGVGHA